MSMLPTVDLRLRGIYNGQAFFFPNGRDPFLDGGFVVGLHGCGFSVSQMFGRRHRTTVYMADRRFTKQYCDRQETVIVREKTVSIVDRIMGGHMNVKSIAGLAVVVGLCCSCSTSSVRENSPEKQVAEKAFASGGNIDMQLDSASYTIRPSSGDQIRVSFGGNTGSATAEITTNGSQATVAVKDAPHNDFQATIEVPKTSNLTIHIKAGNLEVGAITGDKDVTSTAGNVEIAVGNPNDYGSADGSVTAGDLDAGVFGKSGSGFNSRFEWTGPGKFKLHAQLGAGNLVLKR